MGSITICDQCEETMAALPGNIRRSYDYLEFVAPLPTGLRNPPIQHWGWRRAVFKRHTFWEMRTLLPIGSVDLGHVRNSKEFDVAEFWSNRSIISEENWVDELSPGPVHSSRLHALFLVRTEN